jgi:hypothetical protein
MMKIPQYFPSSLIAKVANCHLRTVKRHAAKNAWHGRLVGNTWYFIPPKLLQSKCEAASHLAKHDGMEGFTIGASHRAELFRANLRFAALCALQTAITTMPVDDALVAIARDFTFKVSPSALRVWQKKYTASGFAGLMERKRGHVGRKPKAKP